MPATLPAPKHGFRVASYNIRKCLGIDRRRLPERTLRVINATGAAVVVLQESDRRLGVRPAALTPDLIAQGSDYRPLPVATSGVSLGWHGNAILVRSEVEMLDVHRIELPGLEPRGAVAADLSIDGHALRMVAVHLGLRSADRLHQLRRISDWLATRPRAPTLIMGDFNEWSPTAPFPPLHPEFDVLAPGPSYHARFRLAPLDRIAHCNLLHVTACGVLDQGDAARASDHLPIWADIRAAH
jgi:endonuclease/exonuclease/phosphatase family metal-dependent hydrolase